ncbi:MAG: DUF885 domain-containing protein, partial [Micromonosporaceae bacterium]|nr:DUF885 domain-containing protein [Micromonosporaceae bacterium]
MRMIDDLANRYVDEWAPLNPVSATYVGISGYDHLLTDVSPEGFAALADLDRRTVAQLETVTPVDEAERVAKEVMVERLSSELSRYDAGLQTSELNVISSSLHHIRGIFDLMPLAGEQAAGNISARLAGVPDALRQFQRTLTSAADAGHVVARRQIAEVAKQCDSWLSGDADNFFPGLVDRVLQQSADAGTPVPETLAADLRRGAESAAAGVAGFARFLREQMLPRGVEKDAVGRDRYALESAYFLGAVVDLDEAYAWGFEELARLEAEMRRVADKIVPGGSIDEAVAALDADPARRIAGKDAFRDWMQRLADQAIADLHGTHFDIPEQVRRIECCIAPTSDGGIYYTGPSEDFIRPGRMWWAVPQGVDAFSTWREVTTVYHEGVPGHHLQIAQTQL